MLEKWFELRRNKTTVAVEIEAGVTTFLTMVYILAVNPDLLAMAGMPRDAVFTATALSALTATLAMGVVANLPFALAPGMGMNGFFAFAVVRGHGYSWQEALTAVFLAGAAFTALSLVGARKILVDSVPTPLRHATAVALGFMIVSLGLVNSGLIVHSAVFLQLGDLRGGAPLLTLIGLGVTCILLGLRIKGALLLGILITTIIGIPMRVTDTALLAGGMFKPPPSIAPVAFELAFDSARMLSLDYLLIVLTLLFVALFDSLGTFVGVLTRLGGDVSGDEPRIGRALTVDALGMTAGALFGTSTVTAYAESAAGVSAGGRTGLTALTVAALFFLALFFSPMFLMVPAAATAPAMVVVGMFMCGSTERIRFRDITESLPAVLSIAVTALSWSISEGLAFGWIGFVVLKLFSGRRNELNPIIIAVGVLFLARLILL